MDKPSKIDKFTTGQKVAHIAIGDGFVTAADGKTITVTYDKHSRGRPVTGVYDDQWFRLHPEFLFHRSSP